ncbi:MAG: 1-(5-phosphoribosyl)-5-[(5-phosphoribosylamino)methylideneamino]imidazole-4-carboxamide isomerase [Eubacteriales bacterium]|jgi:phosphoribosylformimino-5-aminoimidazole carboxamide ribotide isomerase|nr:1-(5-phosphoribosyl)-5-[(5-phosphoribosylamino)methylideneamino]imidazole-4-carboxamide isomerase [Clostridiales bacterium]
MIVIPAIDILGGRCVRLKKGDYATAGEVAGDALETARSFAAAGAEYIHMVDLDGAKAGRRVNHELIAHVIAGCGVPVEVGGGVRTLEDIDWYISRGAGRVILGSAAYRDPELVKKAAARYGDKIAVGVDARGGRVAVEGWTETSDKDYITFAREIEAAGVRFAIVTDIERDGMLSGANTAMLAELKKATNLNLIASGGVRDMADIRALASLGIYGAIAGKSIYQGTLDLKEAVLYCKSAGGEL